MADYTLPDEIRLRVLDSGFSRDMSSRFIISQPAAGPYFAQIVQDDAPVYFNVQWTLGRQHAFNFMLWLRNDNGAVLNGAQFNAQIWTEAGFANQACSFTPDGIPQLTSIRGMTYNYNARIMVRRLNLASGLAFLTTEIEQPILTEQGNNMTVEN